MKKRRYFLPLAVGVLTFAITGGVILAQNNNSLEDLTKQLAPSEEGFSSRIGYINEVDSARVNLSHGDAPNPGIVSRLAVILEMEEEVLKDAFSQAVREKQDDTLAYRLEHLVANEKLDQVDADAILDWFFVRPDAATKLHRALLRGVEAVEYRLRHMVHRGVIDEAEAKATLEWYGEMPQALKDLLEQRLHRSPDSKSRGQVWPSERFQGRDMDRPAIEGRRFDRQGFPGANLDRPGSLGHQFGRESFGPPQFPRDGLENRLMPGARGLDQAGRPDYANQP